MTFYQPAMSGNHVKRGEGHNSCTTTTVAVSWLTTQVIPVGASKREDSTTSFCSVP